MSIPTLRFPRSSAVLALALLLAAFALPAAAQGPMKVGVIEVQSIITESATGKAVLAQLETYSKQQQDRLAAQRDEVEQLRNRIAEGQLSLSDDKLTEMQKELEEKSIALRRTADDAQRELNRRQEEAFKSIERKVMPIIEQLGKEGGFTMIFRKFESGLVFATEEIDVTAQVITRLDAQQGG